MWLIIVYIGFMLAGDFVDYLIGALVENIWPGSSLVVFLTLYFIVIWVAWKAAVWATEPKKLASA